MVELYELIKKKEFNIINSLFIIFLYFFLCLTHFEECIYFLVLIILSSIYYLFIEFKAINAISISNTENIEDPIEKESAFFSNIVKREIRYNDH